MIVIDINKREINSVTKYIKATLSFMTIKMDDEKSRVK